MWLSRPVEDTPDDVIPTRRVIDNFLLWKLSNAVTCEKTEQFGRIPQLLPTVCTTFSAICTHSAQAVNNPVHSPG
jgi:hypothetical protein